MKQIVPIVLTALMLTSLFAAIDFADELKDTNEMETGGRAAYELNLHDILQPRETFVDQAGNTRNGIDIGDIVYFRPIIINDGDNAHDEFNIRVTVTPAGDNQAAVIDNLDDAVCPGTTSVTGCSFNTLAAGDFLGGGNYRVQAESGGDLAWSPTIPGEYAVTISIDVDSSMDTDLTNNDMTYTVTVQHFRDIVVDLCWTDGPGGDCKAQGAYDNVQGTGPHNFALMVTAEGSEAWQPRATTVTVDFEGDYDTDPMSPSNLDTDGDGPNSPIAATAGGHRYTVVVGEDADVDVWQNVSTLDDPVTDTNDLAANPCTNGANPCQQTRTVMVFETTYSFHGEIVGDGGADASTSTAVFSITAMLATFESYEPAAGAVGGGPGSGGAGGEEENPSIIMEEQVMDYDDRTGNNDGSISGAFTVFHDIGVTSLTAGDNEATEGTLNVGVTTLKASVIFGGSEGDNSYDWDVTFTVTDENDNDALNGMPGLANECLDDTEDSYSHSLLSETSPGTFPEGKACLDVDLQAGRYTVTATSNMISETSDPTTATDMNSGNNVRATFYEVINDNPTIYMTLDEILRDGSPVDAPVIIGDWITMRARGMDTETPDEGLLYSWSRVTAAGELMNMFECDTSICTVETDISWVGERMVTATVTDANGASASDGMLMSVWNTYSMDEFFDSGASMSYSLVYGPMVNYSVTAQESGMAFTAQQLGNNAGSFDSTIVFGLDITNVMMPADIGTETLTVNFDGDATSPWGLWYKRTTDSPWTNIPVTTAAGASSGTTMTYTHDGSLSGNLGGGTYAIFDVATAGAQPPATGVAGLSAELMPDARVQMTWGYGENPQFATGDTVNIYWCSGASCDPLGGTAIAGQTPGSDESWDLIGTDGTTYTIRVQTENGNEDAITGVKLTGGSMDMTVTADGSVSPAPTLSNAAATVTSTNDGLTFTWDAAGTDDVSAWVLCWAGTQDIVNNDFSGLLGNSCATTEDTTTSITVTEQDMCGGTCNAELYFGIAGKDAVGNVADPGVDMYANMKDGLEEPGVIDTTDPGAEDDSMPSTAIYAIIGLVVMAVIGGAFILTRGAEADGEEKEWDY